MDTGKYLHKFYKITLQYSNIKSFLRKFLCLQFESIFQFSELGFEKQAFSLSQICCMKWFYTENSHLCWKMSLSILPKIYLFFDSVSETEFNSMDHYPYILILNILIHGLNVYFSFKAKILKVVHLKKLSFFFLICFLFDYLLFSKLQI